MEPLQARERKSMIGPKFSWYVLKLQGFCEYMIASLIVIMCILCRNLQLA